MAPVWEADPLKKHMVFTGVCCIAPELHVARQLLLQDDHVNQEAVWVFQAMNGSVTLNCLSCVHSLSCRWSGRQEKTIVSAAGLRKKLRPTGGTSNSSDRSAARKIGGLSCSALSSWEYQRQMPFNL